MLKNIILILLMLIFDNNTLNCAEPKAQELREQQKVLLKLLADLHPKEISNKDNQPWLLSSWDTDLYIRELFIFPSGKGNAAKHFIKLEELYEQEKESGIKPNSQGVKELILASQIKNCQLVPVYYPAITKGGIKQPNFIAYRTYHQALLNLASELYSKEKYQEAERCLKAAYICGWHLTNDRSSIVIYLTGLIFKLRAAQDYQKFLKLQNFNLKAEKVEKYINYITQVVQLFYWKSDTLLGDFKEFSTLPSLIKVALYDTENCWRQEAIIRLGIYRHGAPDILNKEIEYNKYWQYQAEKTLQYFINKPSTENLKKLTIWTIKNIDAKEYQNLHTIFSD